VSVGRDFTYQGPYPWICCLCPALVRAGQQAFFLRKGTSVQIAHAPGTCWLFPYLEEHMQGTLEESAALALLGAL
jgi:hypothetical protein